MKILRDKTGAALRCGTQRVLGAVAVLFLFLGGTAPAAAQGIRLLQINGVRGTVEAGFLTTLEERTRSKSSDSDFDRVELSQLVHLNTYGYIYHPRFLTFDTGIQFEAIEGLAGQSDNRILWGGNFRFNFLESHPNSLSIFGTRIESESAQLFSQTYETTTELYGATFFQKWGWIPFDLSYLHSRRSGGADDQLDDKSDKVLFDGRYRIGERSDGRLVYDIAFEEIQGRDLTRQNLIANNVTFFGEGNDKKWNTNLRIFDERNSVSRSNINGRTGFDWRHSDTLRTRYTLNGRWSDAGPQDSTELDANFIVTHKLYDSLQTDFEIFGILEDASFREREEFGGRLSGNYLKDLGEWGRLNINVSPHARMVYNDMKEDTAFVFDERHVMIGVQPVLLGKPDIIAFSIVVTDENGSIVYDEGALGDYTVIQTGDGIETELRRTPTSTIPDGALVLVDYEFELLGDHDTLQTGVAVHTSLEFLENWRVFGRYDTVDFHVYKGDEDTLRFNDFDRYLTGVEYSRRWLSANAEFEKNDATFGSFWGYSGSVSLHTDAMWTWNASMTADYVHQNYTDDGGENVDRFGLSGGASKRFFKRGLLEVEGGWLRGRWSGQSSDANDIDAVRFKLRYSWWYGKVEVKLETGVAKLYRTFEDSTVFGVDLRVRRVF
jgi:hypothetical protein